jgi:hypothetical protein
MATVTRPATSLPDPGDDLEAEPIRDYINNVLTFLEGNNIDDANVDFTSTDGIMALRKNQTVTGIKTHTGNIVLSGTATIDLNGIANALILDADADTHISAPTDDQIDIAIGGTDLITLATAGSTFSHPVTVGVDDTGYDVKFFGATTGKYMLWDESEDTLAVVGTAITLNGTTLTNFDVTATHTWTADQTFNDNVKVTLGSGGDADLYYDGTNVELNPKVVGSGSFNVQGSVGINESSPDTHLHVNGAYSSTQGTAKLQSNDNDAAKLTLWNKDTDPNTDSRRWAIANNQSNFGDFQIQYGTSSTGDPTTAALAIEKNGMVRIGNTSGGGTHKLYVAASNAGDNIARFDNSSATNPYGVRFDMSGASPDNNSITFLNCVDSTTTRLFIYSDGDVANHDGTYGTISDVKFKQDIMDMRSYWDDFKSLQYRKFRHKADVEADPDAPYRLGLVAQEVEMVFPALVPESPDPLVPIVDVDGEPVLDARMVSQPTRRRRIINGLSPASSKVRSWRVSCRSYKNAMARKAHAYLRLRRE